MKKVNEINILKDEEILENELLSQIKGGLEVEPTKCCGIQFACNNKVSSEPEELQFG